jgi:hypothetical protein
MATYKLSWLFLHSLERGGMSELGPQAASYWRFLDAQKRLKVFRRSLPHGGKLGNSQKVHVSSSGTSSNARFPAGNLASLLNSPELASTGAQIAFRQQIQHKGPLECTVTITVRTFVSGGQRGRICIWFWRRTSGHFTMRTEGRSTENSQPSYSDPWSNPPVAG